MYFLYSINLITDENILKQLKHRESKCKGCPLKNRGWCSKYRTTEKIIHIKKELGSVKTIRKLIRGCGCFLKAKYFVEFGKTKCPLNRWHI